MTFSANLRIKIIFTTLFSVLVGGTILFKHLEPYTWIQAFYFTVTTMTTVGYGDLIPSNDYTRLAVAVFILVSVTLYISLATYLGGAYLHARERKQLEKHQLHKDV